MALSSEPCKAKSHVENRMQGTPRLRDPTAFTITLGEQNACISTETPSSLQDIAVTESITTDETSCLLELPTNNSYDSQLHCEPSSNTDQKKKKHKNHPPARHQLAHQSMSPWTAQSWPSSTTRAPPPPKSLTHVVRYMYVPQPYIASLAIGRQYRTPWFSFR